MRPVIFMLVLLSCGLCRVAEAQVRRTDIQRRINPAFLDRARIVSGGKTDTLGRNDTARVRPGEFVAVPTGAMATRDSTPGPMPDKHVDLPVQIITVDQSGSNVLTLTIRVAAEGAGLSFDPATHKFSGIVFIGLEDSVRRNQQIDLGKPGMALQVTS